MQILADALPGFRDLRGPVIAGYLWIFFTWLLVQPDLDQRPADQLVASVYDLGQHIGHIGIAVSTGVVAYLIGVVSQGLSRALVALRPAIGSDDESEGSGGDGYVSDQLRPLAERGQSLIEHRANQIPGALASSEFREMSFEVMTRLEHAENEVSKELELTALILLSGQPTLFAEVDRLRAEADLRITVSVPLFALILLLTIAGSLWWFGALLVPFTLFQQGLRREADARKIVADAIRVGRVESSSVAKFQQWIEEALPRAIDAVISRASV